MKKKLDVPGVLLDVQVPAHLVQAVAEADVINNVWVLANILAPVLALVVALAPAQVLHINEDFV